MKYKNIFISYIFLLFLFLVVGSVKCYYICYSVELPTPYNIHNTTFELKDDYMIWPVPIMRNGFIKYPNGSNVAFVGNWSGTCSSQFQLLLNITSSNVTWAENEYINVTFYLKTYGMTESYLWYPYSESYVFFNLTDNHIRFRYVPIHNSTEFVIFWSYETTKTNFALNIHESIELYTFKAIVCPMTVHNEVVENVFALLVPFILFIYLPYKFMQTYPKWIAGILIVAIFITGMFMQSVNRYIFILSLLPLTLLFYYFKNKKR